MSTTIYQIASPIFPGYGLSDGKHLPCTGASGSTISISSFTPHSNYNSFHHFKNGSLTCTTRSNTSLFSSGSDIYRRNPDSNREEKHKFSEFYHRLVRRQKNKTYTQNEDDDYSSENLEEPKHFSSRNGSLNYSESPSSSAPLDKEKKAIALFREVQAQIRAKSVQVEKINGSSKPKKDSNKVVSLVQILRKYSVPQTESSSSGKLQDEAGKREPLATSSLHSSFHPQVNDIINSESLVVNGTTFEEMSKNENFENDDKDCEDEIVNPDETEPLVFNRAILEEISEDEALESDEEDNEDEDFESDEEDSEDETVDSDETEPSVLNRAIFEEISEDGAFESDEEDSKDEAFENDEEDSEDEAFESDEEDSEDEIVNSEETKPFTLSRAIIEEISEDKAVESDERDTEYETVDSDEKEPFVLNRAIFEEIYKDFESDEKICEDENDDGKQENNKTMMIDSRDFSRMKLTELRALAKSKGIKGFSKMKKGELKELLIEGTVQ